MIEAIDLSMRYGSTVALDRASFKVGRGEIMGLLGPNGAGKTTAMKILATHLVPTNGTATIGDFDIHENPLEVRRLLGYMPEEPPLYKDMEVAEYLKFVAQGRHLSGARMTERTDWVVESCGIKQVYRKEIKALSRGYRQRVGLAQALLHDPEVIILDEPTTGLDPLQIIGIRKLIKDLSKEKAIVFSTHLMQEASAITNRIVIINQGKIIADSTLDDLLGSMQTDRKTTITIKAGAKEVGDFLTGIPGLKGLNDLGEEGGFVRFEFTTACDSGVCDTLCEMISERGWAVRQFSDNIPTLEEVFLERIKAVKMPAPAAAGGEGAS